MTPFVVEDGSGVVGATSYVSVEESDDIAVLNIHNSDAWLVLPDDVKRNLLMYVSRILDTRTRWNGTQSTPYQGLAWPRSGVTDRYGNCLATSALPFNLKWACVELAKFTMDADRLSKTRPENAVTELKIDSITLKFADAAKISADQLKTPDLVVDLLHGLGSVGNGVRKVAFGRAVRT